jgi:predicted DNA-binding transcriptional regulator YafY
MSVTERRAEIMKIMILRRKSTVPLLMQIFSVSEKTIRRDIRALMLEYPLESVSGNGGGICLPDWFYPDKNLLSKEEITVLEELIPKSNEYQSRILKQMLAKFGTNKYRPCKV